MYKRQYIACEFASIFRGLGARVTQIVRGEQILRGFDEDVRGFLARQMAQHGVELRTGVRPASIERAGDALKLTLSDGSTLAADTVLQATGRRPNTAGLGLQALGVRLDERGAIVVDEAFESSVPGLHAIGDVIDRIQLTPVALAEAMVLVDRLFGSGTRRIDYELVPTASCRTPPCPPLPCASA